MAALTPVASSEALVGVIQKSGLLSADALAKVSAAAEATVDPAQLARDLLKAGTLSKWQAGQLLHGYHQLTIGKYKLLDQLESGAIGRVYLAEHAQMGRRALLKVLSRRQSADPATVKRFLTQAQQACGLDHRNISHVYDVNQDDDRNYVVVEHVEGTDLAQLVEQHGPLPLGEALEYVRQAVEGLIHAHAAGVCHGDLKPANLLLDASGIIKIVDIGQAGLTGSPANGVSADETGEIPIIGNSLFRAPEVAAGEPAEKASDIYSLGNVLCFLVTGKAATSAVSASEQLQATPSVPRALADACVKLMAEKPEDRPASVLEAWNLLATADDPEAEAAQISLAGEGITTSASDSGKSKKTRVAQRLAGNGTNGRLATKSQSELGLAQQEETEESPLAALIVNTGPHEVKQPGASEVKPRAARALKRAVALQPTQEPAGLDTLGPLDAAPATGSLPVATQPDSPSVSPVVIAAALAGVGVLLIAVIAVVWMLVSGKSDTKVAEHTGAKAAAVIVQPPPAAPPTAETNPQVSGETNPTVPAETVPAETNPGIPPAPPAPAPEAGALAKAAIPVSPGTSPPKTEEPATPAEAAPAAPPAAAKSEVPGEAKKDAKADAKDSDKGDKTEAKPAAKPKAAPKAPASPFRGFTVAVALPQLPESAGQPATDAVAPQSLGPCKVDDKGSLAIALRGGATAGRQRQTFDLVPKTDNPREWNFVMVGEEGSLIVATLAAKEGSVIFQWTEGAVEKAQDAGYLCNCALELASGTHRHLAALRMPIEAEPLPVEIDRRGAPERWQIPFMPAPKQVFVEVAKVEGFQQLRLEPAKAVNLGEQITVWTGPDEKTPLLALRIDTKASTSVLSVSLTPHVKPAGSKTTRAYSKKEATTALNQMSREFTQLQAKSSELKKSKPTPPKGVSTTEFNKKLDEYTKITLPNEIADKQTQIEQLKFLTEFSANTDAKIHFRVYHESDAGPIELLKTYVETAAKGKKK